MCSHEYCLSNTVFRVRMDSHLPDTQNLFYLFVKTGDTIPVEFENDITKPKTCVYKIQN